MESVLETESEMFREIGNADSANCYEYWKRQGLAQIRTILTAEGGELVIRDNSVTPAVEIGKSRVLVSSFLMICKVRVQKTDNFLV